MTDFTDVAPQDPAATEVVGVAGCGAMGLPMARRLVHAGFDVLGFDVRSVDEFGDFAPRMVGEPAPISAPVPRVEGNAPPIDTRREPPLRPASGAERMLKDNGVEELSDVAGMTEALKARAAAAERDSGQSTS